MTSSLTHRCIIAFTLLSLSSVCPVLRSDSAADAQQPLLERQADQVTPIEPTEDSPTCVGKWVCREIPESFPEPGIEWMSLDLKEDGTALLLSSDGDIELAGQWQAEEREDPSAGALIEFFDGRRDRADTRRRLYQRAVVNADQLTLENPDDADNQEETFAGFVFLMEDDE